MSVAKQPEETEKRRGGDEEERRMDRLRRTMTGVARLNLARVDQVSPGVARESSSPQCFFSIISVSVFRKHLSDAGGDL